VLADEDLGAIIVPQVFLTIFASIQMLHNAFFVRFILFGGHLRKLRCNCARLAVLRWTGKRKEADAVLYRACAQRVSLSGGRGCSGSASNRRRQVLPKTPTRSGFLRLGD
jgi:hypothetical protein